MGGPFSEGVEARVSSTFTRLETEEDAPPTLWQSVKNSRRVVLYCLAMTSAIMMYGYDYVIVGTVNAMPSFQQKYGFQLDGRWILPSLWLGLWNFISPGCAMFGSVAAGIFQDRYGRRWSLAVGSFLSAAGVAICYVSDQSDDINTRRGVFLAGKGFQGAAIGMVMATTQTYMSEILPTNLRGPVLAFFPVFTLFGQLVGGGVIFACLNKERGYITAFASQWPFSAIPLAVAFLIPESPTYLVRKNLDADAYRAQKRLDMPGVDSEKTLQILRKDIERERLQAQATYLDSFKPANRRRTLIVMFANCLPQIFGLTMLAKSSYFVQVVGMAANTSILVLILGLVCGLLANLVSIYILARVGRRPLIIVSLAVLSVLWLGMGIAGCFSGTVVVWYTAVTLIMVVMVAGLGVWPASYAVGSETSALHLRAKAQGVGWFTGCAATALFGFVLPYIFNPDQGDLGAKTGFVFTGLCAIGSVVSYYVIPEMKGRSPAEIDEMFELRLPARSFRNWSSSSTVEG